MLSTNEHAISYKLLWIRHSFVNRIVYIHTYQVYMMVGKVVSLNCMIR